MIDLFKPPYSYYLDFNLVRLYSRIILTFFSHNFVLVIFRIYSPSTTTLPLMLSRINSDCVFFLLLFIPFCFFCYLLPSEFIPLTPHSQRWMLAVRKDLLGAPVLPAVGWLGGLTLFVKVMGPRWANSQATWCTLCHLGSNPRVKGRWWWGPGTQGGGGDGCLSKIPSALFRLLQLHLKVITRPAMSKQAPYGRAAVGAEAGAPGEPPPPLFGEERPVQTQLMKS